MIHNVVTSYAWMPFLSKTATPQVHSCIAEHLDNPSTSLEWCFRRSKQALWSIICGCSKPSDGTYKSPINDWWWFTGRSKAKTNSSWRHACPEDWWQWIRHGIRDYFKPRSLSIASVPAKWLERESVPDDFDTSYSQGLRKMERWNGDGRIDDKALYP